MTKFKEIKVGEFFKFDNGLDSFNEICVKQSARGYRFRGGVDNAWCDAKVGTINVKVKPARFVSRVV